MTCSCSVLYFLICLDCLCLFCPSISPLALCCHIVICQHSATALHCLYMDNEPLLVMSTTAVFPSNSGPSLQKTFKRPWALFRHFRVLHYCLALKLTQQQHLLWLYASNGHLVLCSADLFVFII